MSKTTNTTQQPRTWADLDETARHFRVSKVTVRRWIAAGRISAYRLGPQAIRVDLLEAESQLCQPIPTVRTGR